jgi:hypothetical protein
VWVQISFKLLTIFINQQIISLLQIMVLQFLHCLFAIVAMFSTADAQCKWVLFIVLLKKKSNAKQTITSLKYFQVLARA